MRQGSKPGDTRFSHVTHVHTWTAGPAQFGQGRAPTAGRRSATGTPHQADTSSRQPGRYRGGPCQAGTSSSWRTKPSRRASIWLRSLADTQGGRCSSVSQAAQQLPPSPAPASPSRGLWIGASPNCAIPPACAGGSPLAVAAQSRFPAPTIPPGSPPSPLAHVAHGACAAAWGTECPPPFADLPLSASHAVQGLPAEASAACCCAPACLDTRAVALSRRQHAPHAQASTASLHAALPRSPEHLARCSGARPLSACSAPSLLATAFAGPGVWSWGVVESQQRGAAGPRGVHSSRVGHAKARCTATARFSTAAHIGTVLARASCRGRWCSVTWAGASQGLDPGDR